MAKDEVLRLRVSKKEKSDLEQAAKSFGEDGVSASEFARVAINNRVKKQLKKDK